MQVANHANHAVPAQVYLSMPMRCIEIIHRNMYMRQRQAMYTKQCRSPWPYQWAFMRLVISLNALDKFFAASCAAWRIARSFCAWVFLALLVSSVRWLSACAYREMANGKLVAIKMTYHIMLMCFSCPCISHCGTAVRTYSAGRRSAGHNRHSNKNIGNGIPSPGRYSWLFRAVAASHTCPASLRNQSSRRTRDSDWKASRWRSRIQRAP